MLNGRPWKARRHQEASEQVDAHAPASAMGSSGMVSPDVEAILNESNLCHKSEHEPAAWFEGTTQFTRRSSNCKY